MLLPPDPREWLPKDHLAWLVIDVVDQLDLKRLEAKYRLGAAGRQAYDPAMLTALLIYAYCCGVRSSRAIERACRSDVAFMVICGQQHPDHVTIARFRSGSEDEIADLFGQVLAICGKAGMGKVGVVSIDGTKIAANASKRRSYRLGTLEKMAADIVAEAGDVDAAEDAEHGPDNSGDDLPPTLRPGADRGQRIRQALASAKAEQADRVAADVAAAAKKADAAHRSMRKARARAQKIHDKAATVRRDRRPIEEHQEVRDAAARIAVVDAELAAAQAGNGRRASQPQPRRNITDPDSRLMATRGDGYLQGYNSQLAVSDDHLIIGYDVTAYTTDQASYQPMVDHTTHNINTRLPGRLLGTMLFDAGYCSHANLTAPGPDRLIATGRDPAKPSHNTAIQQMAYRLEDGTLERLLYQRRQATVEPVNSHLKDRIGLRQYARRGLQAVRAELGLAAIAHNIRRLATT